METGLLHNYFGNFSTQGERYYFMRGEIEPTWGEIEMNIKKLRKTQISFSGGRDLWWWYLIVWGWGQGMGFQTWGWGSWHGDGVPDKEWGSWHGGGFQAQGWGSWHGDGVPDKEWGSWHGMGFQTWAWGSWHGDGVLDMGCGTRHRWGFRHGMKGYQTDDGVPVRGGVTTFRSHQRGILHFLIFFYFVQLCRGTVSSEVSLLQNKLGILFSDPLQIEFY